MLRRAEELPRWWPAVYLHGQEDGEVAIEFDWRIRVDRPLLRAWSWLFKPVFAANHRWAMRQGETSLQLELRRRQARSEAERERIPPPPKPTFVRARGGAFLGERPAG